jgi:hypothetical protein
MTWEMMGRRFFLDHCPRLLVVEIHIFPANKGGELFKVAMRVDVGGVLRMRSSSVMEA